MALFRCIKKKHPDTLSNPSSKRTSASFRSHNNPANGCPDNFLSNGTRYVMLSHDSGLRDRGMRLQIIGHSTSSVLDNFGASSILILVDAETASLASPAQSGSREITSGVLQRQSCALQRNLDQ